MELRHREIGPAGAVGDRNEALYETTLAEENVFRGKLLDVWRQSVRLPDGRKATREIVRHCEAVAILPVTAAGRILLVRQFRKPLDRPLWEIPAGKMEAGEAPVACAERELAEEAGVRAGSLRALGRIATTPGFSNEIIHLFVAEDLQKVCDPSVHADADEFLEVAEVPWREMWRLIQTGEIWDAKTNCAFLYWLASRDLEA